MTPDEGATTLTERLCAQKPFFFLRYGDGALECINKLGAGRTCDGEVYSSTLAKALLDGWEIAKNGENVLLGDWMTTSFGPTAKVYKAEYLALLGNHLPNFIHYDSLKLRWTPPLIDFFRAVKSDTRRKLYLGPDSHAPVTATLNCDHLVTPMVSNLVEQVDCLTEQLKASQCEIILFAAGMAGMVAALRCFAIFPKRTYIHLGSTLDPVFRGVTRSDLMKPASAKRLWAML